MRWSIVLLVGSACKVGTIADTGACGRSPALSYDNFGKPFLGQYCTGCHSSLLPEANRDGAPMGVNFDTYAGVLANAASIPGQATGTDPPMPPGGGPDVSEIAMLSEWLSCTVIPDSERLKAEQ